MSAPELTVVKGGKRSFRTVEAVKRAETDRWKIVEAVEEDVIDRLGEVEAPAHAGADGVNTGLYQLCEEIAAEITDAGAEPLKPKSIAGLYRVAVAWPLESRVEGATYGAHERMFAREDRVRRLTKLVERSSDGKVNRNDVDLWLATLKPASVGSFLDNLERAVRSALLSKGKPWTHVAQGDRDEIASRLRRIAEEVQHAEGKFGR